MPTILDVVNKMEILASGDGTGLKAQSTPIKQAFPGVFEARNFSDKKRDKLADQGKARPDGSYPIVNKQDLKNAKRAIGRGGNNPADRAWINKRAKALGEPKIGETNVDAGGAGSGCHGPNCGRYGGGKGTDKTHVPKSVVVQHHKDLERNFGKRPSWQPDSKGTDVLEKHHGALNKMGFKYSHSTGQGGGHIMHTYKDSATSEGRAYLHERANGNHTTTFKPFRP